MSTRAQREFEMWKTWKANPSEENLLPLMESLQPLVEKRVGEFYRTPAPPPAAIRGYANTQVMRALNNYKPERGTQLNTYVTWHLKKVRTFVVKHQNVGRIPDQRTYNIGKFEEAKEELMEELGYPPDAITLANKLKWSPAEVGRMEAELGRKDLIASINPEPDRMRVDAQEIRERDVMRYIVQDLTPEERTVYEYSLGLYGKPKIPAREIAKRLKISQPKVSRIRKKIDQKIRERGG